MEEDHLRDMCPICKTDKYLSPNMNFLINPECYHKICESCVDRIFSLGPALCPYPSCGKILRKNRFKKQVFEDLAIEKEIDIRKRVAAIYNKTEEDFEDLKQYNKYLEEVENIVFKLNNGIEADQTKEQLEAYESEHKIEILEKNIRESQKNADLKKYQDAMERLKQEKLKIQKQMEMEDVEYSRQQQQNVLDKLAASSSNSDEIMQLSQNNIAKRTNMRKRQLQQITSQLDQQFQRSNPLLHKTQATEADSQATPFTPFMGDRNLNKNYELYSVTDGSDYNNVGSPSSSVYHDPHMFNLAKNKEFLGAGWRLDNVIERVLDETFMGLDCFIETEKQANKA